MKFLLTWYGLSGYISGQNAQLIHDELLHAEGIEVEAIEELMIRRGCAGCPLKPLTFKTLSNGQKLLVVF